MILCTTEIFDSPIISSDGVIHFCLNMRAASPQFYTNFVSPFNRKFLLLLHHMILVEVFVNKTNLTFLSFLYKISIEVS